MNEVSVSKIAVSQNAPTLGTRAMFADPQILGKNEKSEKLLNKHNTHTTRQIKYITIAGAM
jgi:hypothetical protein